MNEPKKITIPQLMAYKPCTTYGAHVVERLYAGREALTLRDVLELEIPAVDRLWVVFCGFWFTHAQYVEIACRIADTAMRFIPAWELRPQAAINAARGFAAGTVTREQLAAAGAAARAAAGAAAGAAARAAAGDAAGAAARAAAGAAAWDAARAAAGAAAWDAAWAAAGDAAWDAAWAAQIEIIRAFLTETESS
jgi:hypothetical protein